MQQQDKLLRGASYNVYSKHGKKSAAFAEKPKENFLFVGMQVEIRSQIKKPNLT